MRILSASVTNFGSYKDLSFDFTNRGLTLISGPTGAGKSTLCDIIPWILFGKTAKNGAADEVISWNTSDMTSGIIHFEINHKPFAIARSRRPNDLWISTDQTKQRGKDLNDTQKLINDTLGVSAETYLAGAYFHEFSQAAQFFTTTAKNRRNITEQLADLTLAKKLQENSSIYNKELKKELTELTQKLLIEKNNLENCKHNYNREVQRAAAWKKGQKDIIAKLEDKMLNYEQAKAETIKDLKAKRTEFEGRQLDRITTLMQENEAIQAYLDKQPDLVAQSSEIKTQIEQLKNDICEHCGSEKDSSKRLVLVKRRHELTQETNRILIQKSTIDSNLNRIKQLKEVTNPYIEQVESEKLRTNTYIEQLDKIKTEVNPYGFTSGTLLGDVDLKEMQVQELQQKVNEVKVEASDIELLGEVIDGLRGTVIVRTVDYLEQSTNKLLEEHFDAEIRVTLDVSEADKLEVGIKKDGNEASFTQLSKGQRQLLKLCWGVSVMKAISNYNGTKFNCLFFDEALDGMDDNIKLKAFNLLESLSTQHESVFVVEHSEQVKAMFSNKISVTLENGESKIENS